MKEYHISIRLADGSTIPATIQREDQDSTCQLLLNAEGIDEVSTSTDYFESFTNIRTRLAQRQILPLCYAASINIWPSGMARDMGQGLKAYKLKLGSRPQEMVDIFSTGPDMEPVTPEEQKAFATSWIESLKKA
jgi:hypothetical protein